MEKANKAAERLARTTGDSYKVVIDHVVALQERNVRFAQGLVDASIKELRSQAESNQAITQEMVERAESQREAFQTLFEESVDAYVDLAYAPFAYFRQGLRLVETEGIGGGFRIPKYDEQNGGEGGEMADGTTADTVPDVT